MRLSNFKLRNFRVLSHEMELLIPKVRFKKHSFNTRIAKNQIRFNYYPLSVIYKNNYIKKYINIALRNSA